MTAYGSDLDARTKRDGIINAARHEQQHAHTRAWTTDQRGIYATACYCPTADAEVTGTATPYRTPYACPACGERVEWSAP